MRKTIISLTHSETGNGVRPIRSSALSHAESARSGPSAERFTKIRPSSPRGVRQAPYTSPTFCRRSRPPRHKPEAQMLPVMGRLLTPSQRLPAL